MPTIRPMELDRYVDSAPPDEFDLRKMHARYKNPDSVGNVIALCSAADFDAFLSRAMRPVLVYVYSSLDASQTHVISEIFHPLLDGTITRVLLLDRIRFPELARKYTFGKPAEQPLLMRLYKRMVLRHFSNTWTYANVSRFVTARTCKRFNGQFLG